MPIPVIGADADMTDFVPAASLDVGAWIRPPPDGGGCYWVLESKFTDTYGLMYYSSMPGLDVNTDDDGEPEVTRVESIGDVLYMKLQQGEVVDVGTDEVEAVARLVGELFE